MSAADPLVFGRRIAIDDGRGRLVSSGADQVGVLGLADQVVGLLEGDVQHLGDRLPGRLSGRPGFERKGGDEGQVVFVAGAGHGSSNFINRLIGIFAARAMMRRSYLLRSGARAHWIATNSRDPRRTDRPR